MIKLISIFSVLPLVLILFLLIQRKIGLPKMKREIYLWGTFLFSSGAIIGSLYFSSVLNFSPCTLCWWARIFIYPTAVISLIGIIRKDFSTHIYNLFLSGLAVLVTSYHSYITFGGNEFLTCDVSGSCLTRYVMEFGFVTIPTMALFVSLFMFINSFLALKGGKSLEN